MATIARFRQILKEQLDAEKTGVLSRWSGESFPGSGCGRQTSAKAGDWARTMTGRPCGSAGFVEKLESALGRVLRTRKPGPKPKRPLGSEK